VVGEVHGSWGKDRRCGVRAWGKVKEAGEVQLGPRGESVSVCRWFGRVNLGRRGSDDDAKDMSLTAPRKRVEQGEHQRDSAVHARRVGPLFDLAGLDVLAPPVLGNLASFRGLGPASVHSHTVIYHLLLFL